MDCTPKTRGTKMVSKRKITREFKLSILQELESKRMAQICREHSLGGSLVSKWKKGYNSNPKEAFKGNGNYGKIIKVQQLPI